MFDNFCKGHEIQNYTITKEIALDWCQKRLNEKDITRRSRGGEMQRFSVFLSKQGYPSYFLPVLPKQGETHTPYIFTKDELKRIFERLAPFNRPMPRQTYLTYPLLIVFFMLWAAYSEAIQYKGDVDAENGSFYPAL